MLWLLLVPAYFLGTFPSAVWIARTKGIDITKEGSGNPGASNIARTLGTDRKSTRLNSSHIPLSRMPSSA